MDDRLSRRLRAVAARLRRFELGWQLAATFAVIAAAAYILQNNAVDGAISTTARWAWLGTSSVAVLIVILKCVVGFRSPLQVAGRVEGTYPELQQGLMTAAQQRPANPDGTFSYLQSTVINQAVRHDALHDWRGLVSSARMGFAWLSTGAAFLLAAYAGKQLWNMPAYFAETVVEDRETIAPIIPGADPVVSPGDVELQRGSSLIVLTQFPGGAPDNAICYSAPLGSGQANKPPGEEDSENSLVKSIDMKSALTDTEFAAYLGTVEEPLEYWIQYDDSLTRRYRVTVYDLPELVRSDASIEFAKYAAEEPREILDTRRVTVPKGSKVTWSLFLNKPVAEVTIDSANADENAAALEASQSSTDPLLWQFSVSAAKTQKWSVRLIDADGRENELPISLQMKVTENREPVIELTSGGDGQVSPLEEFTIAARVRDDFAIGRAGIVYSFAGESSVDLELLSHSKDKRGDISTTIAFESLEAEAGQLLSYYVWAEDLDDAGQPRRILGDRFLVEVRPFDEIYRQGQQPTEQQQRQQQQQQEGGGQQEGAQQTGELLDLQKEIISGTWNVFRRANDETLKSNDDIQVLLEAQEQALTLLDEKAQQTPPEAQQYVTTAREHMQMTMESLAQAIETLSPAALSRALDAEQRAYQELLRMQSREHEIARSQNQSQQSQQSSQSSRQQQIDQLRMDARENNYQEERLASDPEEQAQAEARQVLSRLRELAMRQSDINEQLRQIEAELQTADAEKRRELEEQLKRLREQQEELLREADDLSQRMQDPENEAFDETKQQMEDIRQQLQETNQALREGETSQAISEGTRSEQQLRDMEEQLREEVSGQFAEAMQQMRAEARELERKQEEIIEELKKPQDSDEAGLRTGDNREETQQKLVEQTQRLDQLLTEMKETIEQSEATEPLLAEELYEGFRDAERGDLRERLDLSAQLLDQNMVQPARSEAARALEDMNSLRESIENAAEAVLGNELESLQRAAEQLDQLAEQVERGRRNEEATEASNQPNSNQEQEQQPGQQQPGQQQPGQQQPGQQQPEQQQPGQQQPGQQQPGQQQPGQQQPGQQQPGQQQPGQQQPGQQQPGQQQPGQQQPGQQQPGQQQPGQQQPGQQQPGQQQPGQQQPGQQQPGQQQPGQQQPDGSGGQDGPRSLRPSSEQADSGRLQPNTLREQPPLRDVDPREPQTGGSGMPQSTDGLGGGFEQWDESMDPITGEGFREWSDALRDVEELLGDPELRWQATEIRNSARDMRSEFKRHSAEPTWSEVEDLIADPLRKLQRTVSEELLRRVADKSAIVPIDRDPVPAQFSGAVQEYFENLGKGQ